MFGKTAEAPYAGQRWEYKVETFMAMENEKVLSQRLAELGQAGWELTGVLDKPLGMKRKGEEAYALMFKRQQAGIETR